MRQSYKIEELLQLRASPLVCKPEGLPPAEEWMGPPQDPNPRAKPPVTRGKSEDPSSQQDAGPRRPSIFEARHLSRTSNTLPEDLVLGPPKTLFASARNFNKQTDSTERPNKTLPETDDKKSDKYSSRDKFFKDKDMGDTDTQRRDSRFNYLNGRRDQKDDREEWGTRPRRGFTNDEQDRRFKRNGDREKEFGGHEGKERTEGGYDGQRRGPDRDSNRFESRRLPGRARNEPSWIRDENQQDSGEATDDKPDMRSREWRRDRGGVPLGDRDWSRGHKVEQDPEWMDSVEPEDTKQAHTQEDFQRWKERMKAGGPPGAGNNEEGNDNDQASSAKFEDEEAFGKRETPVSSNSMDKFFGLWNPPPRAGEAKPVPQEEVKKEALSKAAKVKSSRFTSLFSPPAAEPSQREMEPQLPSLPSNPTPPAPPSSSNADHEGFQRILKMLGSGVTIQPASNPASNTDAQQMMHNPRGDGYKNQVSISSPIQEAVFKQEPPPYRDSPPRSRNSGGFEGLLGPKSPRDLPTPNQNKDSDLLLKLMQQAQRPSPITQAQAQPPISTGIHTPGILHMPDLMGRPQLVPKPKPTAPPASFFDDPAIANMPRPAEANEPREQLRRRPTNGPQPPSIYDDLPFHAPQQGQHPHPPSNQPRGQPQHQALPYGMRPPGFEPMPPPPWANSNHQLSLQQSLQHQHQQQAPHHQQHQGPMIAPPPGIPNPPRPTNNFPSGPPLPFPNPMPQGHDGRAPSFPRNPNQGFGLPPGMPPPGYLPGINGPPPPGFPPVPNAHEGGMMGIPGGVAGAQFGNINNSGAGGQGIPRHLLEMLEGRSGMQGHYR